MQYFQPSRQFVYALFSKEFFIIEITQDNIEVVIDIEYSEFLNYIYYMYIILMTYIQND